MEKRIELHAHTKYSNYDGVCEPRKLIQRAFELGLDGICISDEGAQGLPEAYKSLMWLRDGKIGKVSADFRVFYGAEFKIFNTEDSVKSLFSANIIARNQEGIKALYEAVTAANTAFNEECPALSKSWIDANRKNLIIGSCFRNGEISTFAYWDAIQRNQGKFKEFYDYVEVAVPSCVMDETIIRRVVEWAQNNNIPVVATSCPKYLEEEDWETVYKMFRRMAGKKIPAFREEKYYLMSGSQIYKEFRFLGEETAKRIVFTEPMKLVEGIETFKPVAPFVGCPRIPEAYEVLEKACQQGAKQIYGNNVPEPVKKRLDEELKHIKHNGYESIYAIAMHIAEKSKKDGFMTCLRGTGAGSLVAYLSGISPINPMPAHYYCQCGFSDFDVLKISGFHIGDFGGDLPERQCPVCSRKLLKNGFDIRIEPFLEYDWSRIPDFCFTVAESDQQDILKSVANLNGIGRIVYPGVVNVISDRAASEASKEYYKDKESENKKQLIDTLTSKLTGVKTGDGELSYSIIVEPEGESLVSVTPLEYTNDRKALRTHMDYRSIWGEVLKVDCIGHYIPEMLKCLQAESGVDYNDIPFGVKEVYSLFRSPKTLGVASGDIGGVDLGILGVSEIGTSLHDWEILKKAKLKTLNDLTRYLGFIHGTGVWNGNAENLIEKGKALYQTVANRDDILIYLTSLGMDVINATKIMNHVRKGLGVDEQEIKSMESFGVPTWYIDSCQKIQYLFPKAHNAGVAYTSYIMLYYKLYYPKAFYKCWLSICAHSVDFDFVRKGYDNAKQVFGELSKKVYTSLEGGEQSLMYESLVVMEMLVRGIVL